MAIPAECDYCGRQYRIQERFAGEELPCKNCGEYFVVPASTFAAPRSLPPRRSSKGRSRSGMDPQWIVALVVVGIVFLGGIGVVIWSLASRTTDQEVAAADDPESSDSVSTGLFPVASVPLPSFPNELPPPVPHPSGARIHFVDLRQAPGNGSVPGSQMAMRIYLPAGEHNPRTLGCVLVAPAGSNLLRGNPMDADDYHAETLPYVDAGFAVVFYSIDGILHDPDNPSNLEFSRAYKEFKAAHAGVVNGRNALEFVLARLPEVDPQRIYCAGHSSAGVLSLLLAEHEPRINGCLAFAPATDVELRLGEVAENSQIQTLLPGIKTFLKQSSPKTHTKHLECPVFLFHAEDDSNEPIHTTRAFVAQLGAEGKRNTFRTTRTGNHYDSMIQAGIPWGIDWLKQLPTEAGKTYPAPAVVGVADNPPVRGEMVPGRLPPGFDVPHFEPPSSPPGVEPPRIPSRLRPPGFEPPDFQPPNIPRPFTPPGMPRPTERLMTFVLESYSGPGDATQSARQVVRRYPWCDADSVRVDFESRQLVIGVRGGLITSAPVKAALERAGFKLGGVSIRTP